MLAHLPPWSEEIWDQFIMVKKVDGTVPWKGLRSVCGGALINHRDVIGRWEPHGRRRAER